MKTQILKPVTAFLEILNNDPMIYTQYKRNRILEIGSARGGSAMWFTHNLLSWHQESLLVCIDAWTAAGRGRIDYDMFRDFKRNVQSFEHFDKVRPLRADSLSGVSLLYLHYLDESSKSSITAEGAMSRYGDEFGESIHNGYLFDIIYIDGAHTMAEVLTDGLLTIPLLRPGGYLIFDDYTCNPWLQAHARVKEAVD